MFGNLLGGLAILAIHGRVQREGKGGGFGKKKISRKEGRREEGIFGNWNKSTAKRGEFWPVERAAGGLTVGRR